MIECDIDIECIIDALENGVEVKKRKKGIIEKWQIVGKHIIIIAVEDCGDYWLIRHVGKIKATRKKIRIIRGE